MAKRLSKKELKQMVASYHQRLLLRLKQDEGVAIDQYKSLYFKIFEEAYEDGFCHPLSYDLCPQGDGFVYRWIVVRPTINSDTIWDYAREHDWVHSEMKGNEPRYIQIKTVGTWWDEWTFAWIRLMHKTRQHRVKE